LCREDPPFGGHHSRYKALQDLQKQATSFLLFICITIPLQSITRPAEAGYFLFFFYYYYHSRYKALRDLLKQATFSKSPRYEDLM
jgi:hypothetical protein